MAVLYASISVLNLMRAATGSQCREIVLIVKVYFFFEGKNCLARDSSVEHCKIHDSASFFSLYVI